MGNGNLPLVRDAGALEQLVEEIGFLPFVPCGISGFSLQDCTPREMWFVQDVQGPWEWREIVADRAQVAYGKFFRGKAGFISRAWLGHFVIARRGGIDFADRYAAGEIGHSEKRMMDLIAEQGPMLTRDLRRHMEAKDVDRAAIRLQMRTDIVIQRMEYRRDAFGRSYGMGASRLAPLEMVFGEDILDACEDRSQREAEMAIAGHVLTLFPDAREKAALRLARL